MTAPAESSQLYLGELAAHPDIPVHDPSFEQLLQTYGMRPDVLIERPETKFGVARVGRAAVPYVISHSEPLETAEVDIIVEGFGGTETAYAQLGNENVRSGNATLMFNPLRTMHDVLHPGKLLPETVHSVIWHVYNTYGVKRFGIKAHSMGGAAGVDAAEELNRIDNGPRVEHLELIDSVGATDHCFASLLPGSLVLTGEILRASILHPQTIPSTLIHNLTNPVRTIAEMIDASNRRTSPERIDALRTQLGVTVTALYHERDPLFPGKKAKAIIGDAVDAFVLSPRGGHLTPILSPRAVVADLQTGRQLAHLKKAS